MEREPIGFQCPNCGEYQPIDSNNAFLCLFTSPEHAKYSFLAFTCNSNCEQQSFFVDIEDAVGFGYLEHVEVYDEAPQKVQDEWHKVYDPVVDIPPSQALGNALLELQFHNFWEEYNPQPEEF